MDMTTIKLSKATKSSLDELREHPAESYDQVVRKVIHIAKTAKREPKLSQKAVKQIEEARERINRGEYIAWEEVERRLNLHRHR